MSVAGLGVDIIEIDRMERAINRSPNLRSRAFTIDEQEFCDKKKHPEIYYAMRFAAKEAVLKALGCGLSKMKLTDVSVGIDDRGRPQPILTGRAEEIMHEKGILEMHLSLSYTKNTAVASAMAITQEARPAPPEEKVDAMTELATSFKQMRSMLDDIDVSDGENADPMDAPEQEAISTEAEYQSAEYEGLKREREQTSIEEELGGIDVFKKAGAS